MSNPDLYILGHRISRGWLIGLREDAGGYYVILTCNETTMRLVSPTAGPHPGRIETGRVYMRVPKEEYDRINATI
jgi:hypothetical protein